MKIKDTSIIKLQKLINEEIEYRSGAKLITFFNELGFDDSYEKDFPARWKYTKEKLNSINNSKKLKECILKLFSPINYIGYFNELDEYIEDFNQYLDFDNFKIIRNDKVVKIVGVLTNENTLDESIVFDESHIHQQWKKAIERKESDYEGAITSARTLLESVLKYILDEQKISYNENTDLSELYKLVAKSLNLAPEQHQERIFKQILGGANGIVSGLGSLRNKLGDAHGKSKANIKPKERHSELAVNLAGSMAIFLYKTFKEENQL